MFRRSAAAATVPCGHFPCGASFALAMAVAALSLMSSPASSRGADRFDVRAHGAVGDGVTLDTRPLQAALDACGKEGGGTVVVPPGRYLTGSLHLRSRVTLHLEAGARIVGTTNLDLYARPTPTPGMPESGWGKWHRGLIVGERVEDVAITGAGILDGNRVFDPTGEERVRGPHTLVFVECRRFVVRDVTFVDAANYAVYFQVSDDVEFRDAKFIGGWDGIHWRGGPERWCRNVKILGCQFQTGDDAIAGRYWHDTVIRDCLINSSCNGLRLIGPATRLTVANNLFRGPGEEPHRTSGVQRRTNMLSGIILQPGAWDATSGRLDEVLLADNVMERVASPVTLWIKPGNTVGRVTIDGLKAVGVYRAALSVESWAAEPIDHVVLRDVNAEFDGGGQAWPEPATVKGPGVDARPLPAWGLYARNVRRLVLEDVRFSRVEKDTRPVVVAENVEQLDLDDFRHPPESGPGGAIVRRRLP